MAGVLLCHRLRVRQLVIGHAGCSGEVALYGACFSSRQLFTGWMMMLAYFIVLSVGAVAVGRISSVLVSGA